MPIKTTNLSYEEFNDRLFSLLKLVEGIRTKIYADSADIPKITAKDENRNIMGNKS